MSTVVDTSVVIIGGSIVGLCNALFLSHHNVPFILIERHPGSALHPRALGYTARTMEIFRVLGIDNELPPVPAGLARGPRRVETKTLNGQWSEETFWTKANGTDKPNGSQGASKPQAPRAGPPDLSDITPAMQTAVAQDQLEPILRNRALQMGADLRLGWTVTEWSQDDDGVSVIAANASGETLNVRATYMIACDGAGSRIRKDLNISTTGVGSLRTLRSILFRCPSIDHYAASGISQWSISNENLEAFLVTYRDGRWALMSYDASQDSLNQEDQKSTICRVIGEELNDIELLTQGKWDLRGSVAERFSSGRVFLAGDAAHALPPNRGGYGANTGIADGHNLAWKLAAVLSGKSDASLLDTYDQERRAIAFVRHDQIFARDDYKDYVSGTTWEKTKKPTQIIDDVAMELGQLYRSSAIIGADNAALPEAQTPTEWKGQPGTRAPHIKLTRDGQEISSIDLFWSDWVLLCKAAEWNSLAKTVSSVQVILINTDVHEVSDGAFTRSFGVADDGAALVRPDGFIAARWETMCPPEEFLSTFNRVSHAA